MNFQTDPKQVLTSQRLANIYWLIVLFGLLPAIEDFSLPALFRLSAIIAPSWLYWLSLGTLPIGLLMVILKRKPDRLLGLLPGIFLSFVFLIRNLVFPGADTPGWLPGLTLAVCYKISFLYFIANGQRHYWPVLIAALIIWIGMGLPHLILFLAMSFLVDYLYRQWVAIKTQMNALTSEERRRRWFRSLAPVAPVLLFVVAGLILSAQLRRATIDRLYDRSFIAAADSTDYRYNRDHFAVSLESSLGARLSGMNSSLYASFESLQQIAGSVGRDSFAEVAVPIFTRSFPRSFSDIDRAFGEASCEYWDLPCVAKNQAKRSLEYRYGRKLDRSERKLKRQLRRMALASPAISNDSLAIASIERYERHSEGLKTSLSDVLQSFFDATLGASLLGDLLLLFALLFSYLFFVARQGRSKESRKQERENSRWWQGIDALYYLIVLIGLLPVVENYSLFAVFGFPVIDFAWHRDLLTTQQWLYLLSLLLLPVGLFLAVYTRRIDRLLGLLPAIFTALLLVVMIFLVGQEVEQGFAIGLIHYACYKIAFLYFIFTGKLRSLPFVLVALIVWIWIGFFPFVIFVTYSVLVRFIYLAVLQNIRIFRNIGPRKAAWLALKSFLFWSPMLLFIIPSSMVSDKTHKRAVDAIYDNTFITADTAQLPRKYRRDQFERNLSASLDTRFEQYTLAMDSAITAGLQGVDSVNAELPAEALRIFNDNVPPTLGHISPFFQPDPDGCAPLALICEFKECTKVLMNQNYFWWRLRTQLKLAVRMSRFSGENDEKIEDFETTLREGSSEQLTALKKGTQQTFQYFFDFFFFVKLFSDILFGFMVLKSFLYVFARVAFSANEENYVTLMDSSAGMARGKLTKAGNQYTIEPAEGARFFISRAFEPSGHAPKFSIPQWSAAILARITTRNYAMNRVTMQAEGDPVIFRSMGGQEFVEWDIADGEEVIFHFTNFVGMSGEVQLSAVVSLRLTSLLMGRLIFTSAKGPGKLLLQTSGAPITADDSKGRISVPTSRILAWQKNTRFNVESELSFVDVFMSGIYLKKQVDDLVLIDADVKGRSRKGIVRFIRNFLLPV